MKYKISFYEDKNGKSETLDFIDNLRSKAQDSYISSFQFLRFKVFFI